MTSSEDTFHPQNLPGMNWHPLRIMTVKTKPKTPSSVLCHHEKQERGLLSWKDELIHRLIPSTGTSLHDKEEGQEGREKSHRQHWIESSMKILFLQDDLRSHHQLGEQNKENSQGWEGTCMVCGEEIQSWSPIHQTTASFCLIPLGGELGEEKSSSVQRVELEGLQDPSVQEGKPPISFSKRREANPTTT